MADIKSRVKAIIIEKAPNGDNLGMKTDLGFAPNDYQSLADAFNAAFGLHVTPTDLEPLNTINDVVLFLESQ